MQNYKQQKINLLDNLQPDDFRNAASFNQIGDIIDQLNEALYKATIEHKNTLGFIEKAAKHLFREDSLAVARVIGLSQIYLDDKLKHDGAR